MNDTGVFYEVFKMEEVNDTLTLEKTNQGLNIIRDWQIGDLDMIVLSPEEIKELKKFLEEYDN